MAKFRRGDIDSTYNALRPRLGTLSVSGGGGGGNTSLPAHTHDASVITFSPTGNLAADDVAEALAELDSEKLARDGSQTMLGDLDMNTHQISNITDLHMNGPSGQSDIDGVRDISLTGSDIGEGIIDGPRVIDMQGAESDIEGQIRNVNTILMNELTPTTDEVGRIHFDLAEATLVVYVASGP